MVEWTRLIPAVYSVTAKVKINANTVLIQPRRVYERTGHYPRSHEKYSKGWTKYTICAPFPMGTRAHCCPGHNLIIALLCENLVVWPLSHSWLRDEWNCVEHTEWSHLCDNYSGRMQHLLLKCWKSVCRQDLKQPVPFTAQVNRLICLKCITNDMDKMSIIILLFYKSLFGVNF